VPQVGYLQGSYQDARSTKRKKNITITNCVVKKSHISGAMQNNVQISRKISDIQCWARRHENITF